MTSRQGVKGRLWERAVEESGRAAGIPLVRIRLRGSQDEGDFSGVPGLLLEAKNHARLDLAGWLDQASAKCSPGRSPAIVHKRRGRPAGDGYVTLRVTDFWALIRRVTAAATAAEP